MSEFDPRRAEPGQEFTYTTNVDDEIEADEDVPAGGEVIGIRLVNEGKDNERPVRVVRRFGVQRTLRADAQGVVTPGNSEDEAILVGFGLPVARAAKEEAKTAKAEKAEG